MVATSIIVPNLGMKKYPFSQKIPPPSMSGIPPTIQPRGRQSRSRTRSRSPAGSDVGKSRRERSTESQPLPQQQQQQNAPITADRIRALEESLLQSRIRLADANLSPFVRASLQSHVDRLESDLSLAPPPTINTPIHPESEYVVVITGHSGGPCASSMDTPAVQYLETARYEELAMQTQVGNIYAQNFATQPVAGFEYIQWEHVKGSVNHHAIYPCGRCHGCRRCGSLRQSIRILVHCGAWELLFEPASGRDSWCLPWTTCFWPCWWPFWHARFW
ncbi:hypothetical protein BDR22DRAFT_377808 [Usnea florida]